MADIFLIALYIVAGQGGRAWARSRPPGGSISSPAVSSPRWSSAFLTSAAQAVEAACRRRPAERCQVGAMSQDRNRFTCTACGAKHPRQNGPGRCDACGAWNTIQEDRAALRRPGEVRSLGGVKGRAAGADGSRAPRRRHRRAPIPGVDELDRVLGGGLVQRPRRLLVGGDPGIGKSTLLLQAAARFARGRAERRSMSRARRPAPRCSMRAQRLGLGTESPVKLAAETNLRDILNHARCTRRARSRHHRFDPDHVGSTMSRPRPVQREPGAVRRA